MTFPTVVKIVGDSEVVAKVVKVVPMPGIKGIQGPNGLQGIQGRQGNTGTSFLWSSEWDPGTTYPLNYVVSYQNSSYIKVADGGSFPIPTNNTYWNLMASKGQNGIQGLTGIQGSYGVQGILGLQGSQGVQGRSIQGNTGLQGNTGIQGRTGTQGFNGDIGARGLQGFTGTQGLTGTQGTTSGITYKPGIPANQNSSGNIGQMAIDGTSNILYICTATNTWRSISLNSASFTNIGGFA